MDFTEAVDWVGRNRKKIRGRIEVIRIYSPYDEEEYTQEAFVAAFKAVLCGRMKLSPFEALFWKIFQKQICKMTPNPGTSGSNSIPSNLCDVDIDTVDFPQEEKDEGTDIEVIYDRISPYLTAREQRVLSLKLGLTYEGALSNYEIASLLGCSEFNVRNTLNTALMRIKELVKAGKIKPVREH